MSLSCPRTPQRLRVESVLVSPGEAVAAGQVLARMDASEVDAELAAARLDLERLELEVVSLEIRRRDDRARATNQLEVQAERAVLELAQVSAEAQHDRSELSQLEALMLQEQGLVADRLADFERLEELKLRRAGLVAKLSDQQGAVEHARRGAAAAGRRLSDWRGVPVAGASLPLREELAPAGAAVAAQRDHLRELEATRMRLELKAPFDGRVEQVLLHPGETAAADGIVVTVVDDRPTRAVAYVDERMATHVHVGDRARLVPRDSSGPSVVGRVEALGPAIAELPARFSPFPAQRRYGRTVYIQLDAPASLPGQAFDASFRAESGGGR